MKKVLLLLALVFGIHSSCFAFATVVTTIKGGDSIVFNSNVQDMDVYLNDVMVGKYTNGAFTYKVKRDGKPKVFVFKKSGYKEVSVTLTTSFDNMFWGNMLIGGSLGSSTDSWFTNNSQEYSPNQFFIQLEKA
jgi:hypothetical protein